MQIQNNQLAFQGKKANLIRHWLNDGSSGFNTRKIPHTKKYVAACVAVKNGKLQPVSNDVIKVVSKAPELFTIGNTRAQALICRIRSLMKLL